MQKSTNNLIWFILGLIFVIVVLAATYFSLATSSSSDSLALDLETSVSTVTANEVNFDFGTIAMKEGRVSHRFQLKNEGPKAIMINKVYTSCMCTTANVISASGKKSGPYGMPGHSGVARGKIAVAAGEEFQVEAIFDPAAHGPSGVGINRRTIYLETNSLPTPKVELSFVADVTN